MKIVSNLFLKQGDVMKKLILFLRTLKWTILLIKLLVEDLILLKN